VSLASYCNNIHPHFLSVWWDEHGEINWNSECPGYDDCQVWYECEACPHEPSREEQLEGVYISHGYAHFLIDGFWAIDDGNHHCALVADDGAINQAASLAKRLKGGIWPVSVRSQLGKWNVHHAPGEYRK
jgi:hypothetical protein